MGRASGVFPIIFEDSVKNLFDTYSTCHIMNVETIQCSIDLVCNQNVVDKIPCEQA